MATINSGSVLFLTVCLLSFCSSAMVAQDRVLEMVEQVQNLMANNRSEPAVTDEQSPAEKEISQPLSLQLDVLRVTNLLNDEMSQPKWQAMLRALGGDREILKRFSQLRPGFTALEKQILMGEIDENLSKLADLETSTTWSRLWSQIQLLVKNVNDLHEWFDRYQRNAAVVNERTLLNYAETVHGNEGVTTGKVIESIHKAVCPDLLDVAYDTDSFLEERNETVAVSEALICPGGAFDSLQTALKQAGNEFICSLSKSPHQLIYDLYNLLALTDAKGYAMMQFSWVLLRLLGRGTFTRESEAAKASYLSGLEEMTRAARSVLSNQTTWMWKCDTPNNDEQQETNATNQTHIAFTELLQGFIVNEVDMNPDNTCKASCSAYTNSEETSCFANQFCARSRRCKGGRIYNCGFVEADSTVCTSNYTQPRRYEWIEYKSGRVHGRKTACDEAGQHKQKVDSWWRFLYHCSYCSCLCDQPGLQSDRYISLQSVEASAHGNYVVTGLRFAKEGRMVHIQIQEGEALPRGMINSSTVTWRPIVPVSIPRYNRDSTDDGPGYATLRYEERALDLDDLTAPDGHVITGVRFRKLGGHINLEVQVTPIEFSTGLVDAERSTWISNDNTPVSEYPRKKLPLDSRDVPTNSPLISVPDSEPDSYIEFQPTSLESDVSQTTVPFLDATAVVPEPPTWLKGIGVYHKGQPGYGGYVAFRVATLDYSDYMVTPSNFTSSTDRNTDY